ncbi:THO complex subunit 4A-like [Bradysia coprophila]|uniref:THO complex subunit 4A-like n=1 Tax=Bradysia coprophila TaxID=38358 RepID=UPI00187DB33A|nr:THO complex subunit 4A-like [Bradysia coprophila]
MQSDVNRRRNILFNKMAQGSRFKLLFSKNKPKPKPDINETWQHDMFEPYEESFRADERQSRRRENHRSAQINLSNLERKVSKEDLYDLFSLIGNLQDVRLACDRYGRSEGTAIIVFERNVDAVEAMHRYNGCCLDNKVLKMELMHSSSETSVPVRYKNSISNDIQTNDVTSRSHMMDVQNVVDHFAYLQINK